MSCVASIARPYAKAAYAFAQKQQQELVWAQMLAQLQTIIEHERIQALLFAPGSDQVAIAEAVICVAKEGLNQHGQNFVRLLAKNKRLDVIAAIRAAFVQCRDAAQNHATVHVRSVQALSEVSKARLEKKVAVFFNRQCAMHYEIDPALLGGLVVRCKDTVIDGSLQGQLAQIKTYFTSQERV
jgi:F-type H+-transporting ATPase subunit delta